MKIIKCKYCSKEARRTGFKYGIDICASCFFKKREIFKPTFEPTYWIDKMGFPNRKRYEEILEAEEKEVQIFSFSWSTILFLFICLLGVLLLLVFVK